MIEILFAIMLLAIGFIMISGALLVGTVQTQTTIQNVTGDAIAKGAVKILEAGLHYNSPMNTDGKLHSVDDDANSFQYIQLDRINSTDNRYGWVPFYRCTNAASHLFQVYAIATQCRNASTYPLSGAVPTPANYLGCDLTPQKLTATLTLGTGGGPDTITSLSGSLPVRAATGGYVIIQTHPNTQCIGMIFQLGAALAGGTGFELVPGRDVQSKTPNPAAAGITVYVVGPGLTDPTNASPATNLPAGKPQDIAVYPLPSSGNAGATVSIQP